MNHRWSRRAAALTAATLAFAGSTAALADQAGTHGPNNDITDVPGVQVGNFTDAGGQTGATVVYFPNRAVGGVDTRGGSPSTRETDLLDPVNEVQHANAFLLAGGGDDGLAAGPGVMSYLNDQHVGYNIGTPTQVVPIVPGAAVTDLGRLRKGTHPDGAAGTQAAAAAFGAPPGPIAQGNVGAGTGAVAGGLKGGLGSASQVVAIPSLGSFVVGALVIVGSTGSPVDAPGGCSLLGANLQLAAEFPALKAPPGGCAGFSPPGAPGGSSLLQRGGVIGVVATSAGLDKALAKKMANVAHDGVSRSVGSAHSTFDSDTFFAAGTGTDQTFASCRAEIGLSSVVCLLAFNEILQAAADTVSRALVRAMISARSVDGAQSYCDRFPGACAPPVGASPAAAAGAGSAAGGTPSLAVPTLPSPSGVPLPRPSLAWALILAALAVAVVPRARQRRSREARP